MRSAIIAGVLAVAGSASGQMRITEWMYNDSPEFVEFTNVGGAPVDMTGWSFDDDSALPGVFDLSGFGIVAPGESVVITEGTAAGFRAEWGLAASVKVLGGYTNNLGRGDQINLFDGLVLADRLTYGDQIFAGSIRTQNRSGVPTSLAALGADDVLQWGFADTVSGGGPYDLSSLYGGQGFATSSFGQTGNPGAFFVPAPASAALLGLAGIVAGRRKR